MMRVNKAFFTSALAGVLIGLGCVLPGVSGGVIAVSFGLYQPMLKAVLGIFKQFRRSVAFLLPLAIGGVVGVLLGAKGLGLFMQRYEAPLLFLFTGFIVGGMPDLLREADGGEGFRPCYLWALALGIAVALPLALLPQHGAAVGKLSAAQALVAGLIEGIGTVVPGISSSFVLIHLGWYAAYLQAVATLDVRTLVPLALGMIASGILCMKAVAWLFDHVRPYAYYGVLGFLLVSVGLVFPGFGNGSALVVELAMLALGLGASLWMGRIGTAQTACGAA